MQNRQNFLFHRDSYLMIKHLVPQYANYVSIHKDHFGYWLNVHWKCGIIATLTTRELLQALGEEKC